MLKILNNFFYKITGLSIINLKRRNQYNLDNTISNLFKLIKKINKNKKIIIFDVGGNKGRFVELFSNLVEKENIVNYEIHYFEPIKFLYKHVKEKNFKNIIYNNFALGDKNENKLFYEYDKNENLENKYGPIRGKSSFLKFNKNNKIEKNSSKNQYKSKIMTIDKYCKLNKIKKINFLKIDTQGYNINTLKGSKNLIKNELIDVIYTELTVSERYQKKETFYELEKALNNNYELFGFDIPYLVKIHSRFLLKNLNLDIFYTSKKIINKL